EGSVIVPARSPEVRDCAVAGVTCHVISTATTKNISQLRNRIENLHRNESSSSRIGYAKFTIRGGASRFCLRRQKSVFRQKCCGNYTSGGERSRRENFAGEMFKGSKS